MKKFFWALMLVATTLSFVACEEDKPVVNPDDPTEEVCKDCGKNPCECEDEEVCPDCGKNPCECEDEPVAEADWCDYYFKIEASCDNSVIYGIGEFDFTTLTNKNGKTIHEVLGFSSFEELSAAVGTKADALNFDREVIVFGYDLGAGMEYQNAYNTNGFGYWVDANSNPVGYGENAKCFIEWFDNEDATGMASTGTYGVMNQQEGETLNACIIFQRTVDGTVTTAGLHVVITVGAFDDPYKGQFPETATPGTFDVNIEGEISLSALTSRYEPVEWVEPIKTIFEKLGMTPYEMSQLGNPVVDDEGVLYTGLQVSAYEYWLDAENNPVGWSDDGSAGNIICLKWYYGADYYGSSACVCPTAPEIGTFYTDAVAACVGKTFTSQFNITYIPDVDEDYIPDQDATIININMSVKIVD